MSFIQNFLLRINRGLDVDVLLTILKFEVTGAISVILVGVLNLGISTSVLLFSVIVRFKSTFVAAEITQENQYNEDSII